jgi:competence ComEA-like helix-hairpin-helix protein
MRTTILFSLLMFAATSAFAGPPEQIEINKAIFADFVKVDGIGKTTADKILKYRKSVGTIERMGQLKDVERIGKNKIKLLSCYFYAEKEGKLPCTLPQVQQGDKDFPININTADIKKLKKLPRIGEKTATKIIAYRQEHGFFHTVDDLGRIKGIGKTMLAKFQELVICKLDINKATGSEFVAMGLPNGDQIVAFRKEKGPFPTVDSLKKVPKIDVPAIDKIKPFLIAVQPRK